MENVSKYERASVFGGNNREAKKNRQQKIRKPLEKGRRKFKA